MLVMKNPATGDFHALLHRSACLGGGNSQRNAGHGGSEQDEPFIISHRFCSLGRSRPPRLPAPAVPKYCSNSSLSRNPSPFLSMDSNCCCMRSGASALLILPSLLVSHSANKWSTRSWGV